MWKRILPLLLVALAGWWFVTGDVGPEIWRRYVGRGKQLSISTMDDGYNVDQSIDDLVAQASATMGRTVSQDAYCLARESGSENPGATVEEKTCLQWILKNDAAAHGWSLFKTLTVTNPKVPQAAAGFLGHQAGRRFASYLDPHEDDLQIAEMILNNEIPDPTYGATHFVHKSPAFVASGGWARTLANWSALAPVYPHIGILVFFVPAAQAEGIQAQIDGATS